MQERKEQPKKIKKEKVEKSKKQMTEMAKDDNNQVGVRGFSFIIFFKEEKKIDSVYMVHIYIYIYIYIYI